MIHRASPAARDDFQRAVTDPRMRDPEPSHTSPRQFKEEGWLYGNVHNWMYLTMIVFFCGIIMAAGAQGFLPSFAGALFAAGSMLFLLILKVQPHANSRRELLSKILIGIMVYSSLVGLIMWLTHG